uniref:Uncharacterized protein n=1 Tax=Anguilla anguilla TaxID=7936 RepID=A0A0E9SGT7_ANGAN
MLLVYFCFLNDIFLLFTYERTRLFYCQHAHCSTYVLLDSPVYGVKPHKM